MYFTLLRLKRINSKNESIAFTSRTNIQCSNKGGNSFDETSNEINKKITEMSLEMNTVLSLLFGKLNTSSVFIPDLILNMVGEGRGGCSDEFFLTRK